MVLPAHAAGVSGGRMAEECWVLDVHGLDQDRAHIFQNWLTMRTNLEFYLSFLFLIFYTIYVENHNENLYLRQHSGCSSRNCAHPFGNSVEVGVPLTSCIYFWHGTTQMVKTSAGHACPELWKTRKWLFHVGREGKKAPQVTARVQQLFRHQEHMK